MHRNDVNLEFIRKKNQKESLAKIEYKICSGYNIKVKKEKRIL